jgi:regulator of sigma E protease
MGIIIALFVLSLLIFLHELGHFIAARSFGVHVEVFSIGFGKRLWTKKIGRTEWSISAIPLGGYVKMKGQDDTDPTQRIDAPDSYNTKAPWQRIVILLAGPAANFATAFVLYWIIALSGVPQLEPFVDSVQNDTPALKAGIMHGDRILSVNGENVTQWDDIGTFINASEQSVITIVVDRNGTKQIFSIIPETIETKNIFGEKEKRRIIGITPMKKIKTVRYDPLNALGYAWKQTVEASKLIFLSVEKLITGVVGTEQLGGVISIVDVTAKASHQGFLALLWLTALISVNLGVLNLLPIPALDGGHIVFNLYEWIVRRPPNETVIYYLTVAGWVILFGLMGLGLYNDIQRLSE